MRVLFCAAALAATIVNVQADTVCKTIADNSQAIRLLDGHSEDMVFTGPDATDFFAVMTRLLGPMPWTPADLNAISAHIYKHGTAQRVATVHFYGGAGGCDVGFDADMTTGLLEMIVSKVGIRI
jgi:hypothetical protein